MARLNLETRKRVIVLLRAGYSMRKIYDRLHDEGILLTLRSLYRLRKKFHQFHTISDLPRRKRSRKITMEMAQLIDDMLKDNDELTARKVRSNLEERFPHLRVSIATVKRVRRENGWVCTRPHYCQLIREVNKEKRLVWCQEQMKDGEQFENVVFTDECTVQLDHHGRLCFRKQKQPRALKQRAKHPAKVHIWGGISVRGATRIVIFTGNMNAIRYVYSCSQLAM